MLLFCGVFRLVGTCGVGVDGFGIAGEAFFPVRYCELWALYKQKGTEETEQKPVEMLEKKESELFGFENTACPVDTVFTSPVKTVFASCHLALDDLPEYQTELEEARVIDRKMSQMSRKISQA